MAWHTDLAIATATDAALQVERNRLLIALGLSSAYAANVDLWQTFFSTRPQYGTGALVECKVRFVAGTDIPAEYAWLRLATQALSIADTYADGQVSVPYSSSAGTVGGVGPYTFTLFSGSLPDGLSLAANGALTGTPTVANTFNFTVQLTDGVGTTTTAPISITIIP